MNPDISARIRGAADPVIPVISALIDANPGTISMGQGVVSYAPPPQVWEQIEEFCAHPEQHRYQELYGGTIPTSDALPQGIQLRIPDRSSTVSQFFPHLGVDGSRP